MWFERLGGLHNAGDPVDLELVLTVKYSKRLRARRAAIASTSDLERLA